MGLNGKGKRCILKYIYGLCYWMDLAFGNYTRLGHWEGWNLRINMDFFVPPSPPLSVCLHSVSLWLFSLCVCVSAHPRHNLLYCTTN